MGEKSISYRTAAVTLTMAILTLFGVGNAAFAQQPYAGGYGKDSTVIYKADYAHMRQWFIDENGDNDIDEDVLSVLSLAGSSGLTSGVTGFSYQAVARWDIDGYIYTSDQVWGPNSGHTSATWQDSISDKQLTSKSTLNYVSSLVYWSSDKTKVNFQHLYVKTDGSSYTHTATHTKNSWDTSTNFLFGECKGTACFSDNPSTVEYRFFQFGIEGETEATNFQVKQELIRFKNVATGSYIYLDTKDAYLNYGNSAQHTWWTSNIGVENPYIIGGWDYYDVYAKAKLTDGSHSDGWTTWDYKSCGGTRCQSNEQQLW